MHAVKHRYRGFSRPEIARSCPISKSPSQWARESESLTECLRLPHPLAAANRRVGVEWIMPPAEQPHRLSSGVVVIALAQRRLKFLLLRAYRNWDFPKGLVEPGEEPIDAALREVREETTLDDLSFDWGLEFMETGPYNKGKISRYYVARSKETQVRLPINPELGMPEHHEACWVDYARALSMVSPRLQPVVSWAHALINHEPARKP